MALARTGRPEQERVFALGDEAGGGELEDERAVDLLVEGEVEAVPLEFVGDERGDEVGGHLFDLGLLPARFEDVGHSRVGHSGVAGPSPPFTAALDLTPGTSDPSAGRRRALRAAELPAPRTWPPIALALDPEYSP